MSNQPYTAILDAQFEAVFDALPVPVLVLQPDMPSYTVMAANHAWLSALHMDRGSITGRSVFDLFPGDGVSAVTENKARIAGSLQLVAETGQPHTIPFVKYEQTDMSGNLPPRYWSISNAPVKAPDGTIRYIVFTANDITRETVDHAVEKATNAAQAKEDVAAAVALETRTSAAYLQAVIDTAQTGIFLFDPVSNEAGDVTDFRFVAANRMLAAYVHQTPEAIIGTLGSEWFPGYKTNGLFDYYADTYLTGNTNRFNFHYNVDNIDAWLDIMATRVNGLVLVTFADYTPLKQMQQKMEESLAELKRSNHNLEEFAYIASHDLQEPLRKIKAFGDILVKRYSEPLGQEGSDMIGRIQSAAERMRYLIEDLLTFSRISNQKSNFCPVQLNEVVQGVLTDLESVVKEKNAHISVERMYPCSGDPSQMRQLFQNLLSNALKFTRKDRVPEIDIRAEIVIGRDSGFDLLPAMQKQLFQLITVADNGIGFEPQYAEKIFQIFQRLHGRTEYPGTGVGLSIVQKVVLLHHGYIRAESGPGQGATFRILLPYTKN